MPWNVMTDELAEPGEVALERTVGPAAWMRGDGMKSMPDDERDAWLRSGHADIAAAYNQPLYDQATLDAAVAAERERCATVCEALMFRSDRPHTPMDCAEAIRGA